MMGEGISIATLFRSDHEGPILLENVWCMMTDNKNGSVISHHIQMIWVNTLFQSHQSTNWSNNHSYTPIQTNRIILSLISFVAVSWLEHEGVESWPVLTRLPSWWYSNIFLTLRIRATSWLRHPLFSHVKYVPSSFLSHLNLFHAEFIKSIGILWAQSHSQP